MINAGYSKSAEMKMLRIHHTVVIHEGMLCRSIADAFSHVPGPLALKTIEDTDNGVKLHFIEERNVE